MFLRLIRAVAPFLLFLAAAAPAQTDAPISPAELRRHIDALASEAFQGRGPATEGERLTTAYIAEQFRSRGLEPAGESGSWFQPVRLVERTTRSRHASWSAGRRRLPFDQSQIELQGRGTRESVHNAPVVFAGHGARIPDRGIDQLAGTDVRGAVVIILFEAPEVEGFPDYAERVRGLAEAGAAAVISVRGPELRWDYVARTFRTTVPKLAEQTVPPILGAMPLAAAQRLIAAAGGDLERLLNDQPGSSFRAVTLPVRADLDVRTDVHAYTTNNVIGRLRGTGGGRESVLFLGHWDHLGICRAEGADRICNGAVDNASGIAALIEVAGRLARPPRPVRDILFLATTSEEEGLLGAEFFARHPPVPLRSIVAAVNLDTMAVASAGHAVDYAGRGDAALDEAIAAAVAARGRRLDEARTGEEFAQRNDAWALARAGVPAVGLIGGAFSSPDELNAYLTTRYHDPSDEPQGIVLEGAAEDADLIVTLGRRLADPALYRRPEGAQE